MMKVNLIGDYKVYTGRNRSQEYNSAIVLWAFGQKPTSDILVSYKTATGSVWKRQMVGRRKEMHHAQKP